MFLKELFTHATQGRYKVLHLTWFAFFLTFVVWFNFPPLATTIGQEFGLTPAQLGTIGLCNVALTVPARIIIGMLLDKYGPRLTYSVLLVYAAIPCFIFATAQSFGQLVFGRLLMGLVGAGFVIGISYDRRVVPPQRGGHCRRHLRWLGQLWLCLFGLHHGDFWSVPGIFTRCLPVPRG